MSKLSEIEVLAKEAAVQAIKDFRADEKKREKRAILHNTEILLKEYQELKYFFENCTESDMVCDEEIVVGSLRKDKVTTRLLYHHVNKCLHRLRQKEKEKIKVIDILYLEPHYIAWKWDDKINESMERCKISQATAYRWKNDIISDLGVMLFGADGLRIWTI